MTMPPAALPRDCLNCGAPLADPRPRFCGRCGQETNLLPPKFMEFAQQFGGAYFSTEGALWRTLALLLFKPGELTRRYRAGKRKHYVLPLRLYITISLLTLLLMRLFLPSDMKVGSELAFDAGESASNVTLIELGAGRDAGMKDGKFYCNDLPAWLCTRLSARLDLDAKSLARDLARLPERFIGHFGTAMFLLVPLFALLHQIAYLGRRMRYTEHLVYALHVHSFWFAALALALVPWGAVAAAMALVVPVYTLIAAKRVYGGGWFSTLARAALIGFTYLVIVSLALVVVGVWAFFS